MSTNSFTLRNRDILGALKSCVAKTDMPFPVKLFKFSACSRSVNMGYW